MLMRRWVVRGLVFALAIMVGLAYVMLSKGRVSYRPVRQPLLFNHYLHTHQEELECKACHRGVDRTYHATLPNLQVCSSCHLEPKGETDKEQEFISKYVDPEREIPWHRLFVLPDHVFFSHRHHVVTAGIECQTCHGPMGEQILPPSKPLKVLTMQECMDCHNRMQAATDCNACHK